ncbi:probable receptor-like protein kinase At1g11050 [Dioscorea cayenensis subsp. rotundata]|uniref:Probable receptor-like protein kinase At1g11050 n=1 Tax=Dioscorea cayennensis subsp. rotundata TaxID=55577 RepID=A0AB40AUR5_DIOCR|nr:probable receptor-like protein kinase At1g11050 [Dioscorea cayenensis subsp. rotundata]
MARMSSIPSLILFLPSFSAIPPPSSSSSCPLDLSYITTYPWDHSHCIPSTTNPNLTNCRQTLLSLYAIALALRLRSTSQFRLPSLNSSISCLSTFQSQLSSLSLPSNLISTHFYSPSYFVISPNFCASIQTKQDWISKLGNSTAVDSACSAVPPNPTTSCQPCYLAGVSVSSNLTALDGNRSHSDNCFYLTVLYAAGISNSAGPQNPLVAACIFSLDITHSSPSHRSHAFLYAIIGAAFAILFLPFIIVLYLFWSRRCKTAAPAFNQEENPRSRPHLRPNTGSIWFKIRDLEKATSFFSHHNLIGRGGFGVVYKGILSDGTPVAVKQILDSDFEGDEEFRNEVEIISNLRHRNLVPLRLLHHQRPQPPTLPRLRPHAKR